MNVYRLLGYLGMLLVSEAFAQLTESSIEGYWQDSARRILFSAEAPPGDAYGAWTALDDKQTYPSAKRIAPTPAGVEVTDLLYGDDHAIEVVGASKDTIEFTRIAKASGCAMHHSCRLVGAELLCALQNLCLVQGQKVVDWRGEERYVRRSHCERVGRLPEAQGIPNRCR